MCDEKKIQGKSEIIKMISTEDSVFDLWILIGQVRQVMLKSRRNELNPYNISPRKASVLIVIDSIGAAATPATISKWLKLEPHSVSEFLSRMEADGELKKTNDLERKNLVRISLTDKGRKLLEIVRNNRKSIHRIMSVLSDEEQTLLEKYMLMLAEATMSELGSHDGLPFPS